MLILTISGTPMSCPRPRATKHGRIYMPPEYQLHKKSICMEMRRAKILQQWNCDDETPLKLEIHFFFKRPKVKKGKGEQPEPKTTKPDVDNLVKTIMDSLQDAEIIKDDKTIVEIHAKKWHARKNEQPHTNIILEVSK